MSCREGKWGWMLSRPTASRASSPTKESDDTLSRILPPVSDRMEALRHFRRASLFPGVSLCDSQAQTQEPAIHGEALAGDVRRLFHGQEGDRRRDFMWLPDALQGCSGKDACVTIGLRKHGFRERCTDVPWCNGVHPDTVSAPRPNCVSIGSRLLCSWHKHLHFPHRQKRLHWPHSPPLGFYLA